MTTEELIDRSTVNDTRKQQLLATPVEHIDITKFDARPIVEAMGKTVDDLWLKQRMDNCQISRLEWTAEGGLELIELADVRHLEEVGSLRGWRTTDRDQHA